MSLAHILSDSATGKEVGDYILGKLIGCGTFGKVYKATSKSRPQEAARAIKKIDLSRCEGKDREHAEEEVEHMKQLNHPNIVGFITHHTSFNADGHRYMYLVMELCELGTLREYIDKQADGLQELDFLHITFDICNGIKYLHDKGFIHRDIKPTNILLTMKDDQRIVKIADLGLLKPAKFATTLVGTVMYMSPEMHVKENYDKQIDIWSLGLCCLEMLTKGLDHFSISRTSSLLDVTAFIKERLEKVRETLAACKYSDRIKDLVSSMLQMSPEKRPVIDKILDQVAELQSRQAQSARSASRRQAGLSMTWAAGDSKKVIKKKSILKKKKHALSDGNSSVDESGYDTSTPARQCPPISSAQANDRVAHRRDCGPSTTPIHKSGSDRATAANEREYDTRTPRPARRHSESDRLRATTDYVPVTESHATRHDGRRPVAHGKSHGPCASGRADSAFDRRTTANEHKRVTNVHDKHESDTAAVRNNTVKTTRKSEKGAHDKVHDREVVHGKEHDADSSSSSSGGRTSATVAVPAYVMMTEDQKNCLTKTQELLKTLENESGFDEATLADIKEEIHNTKDDCNMFMNKMNEKFGIEKHTRRHADLMSLWAYMSPLIGQQYSLNI